MNLDEELKIYMQTVQCLDESMDDYLYVYDLANDQLYFADKIREKYDLPLGKEGISLPEWAKIVYPKDLEQLEQNIRDIKNQVGKDTIILSVLNGVESEKQIAAVYGSEHLLYSYMRISIVMKDGKTEFDPHKGLIHFGDLKNDPEHYSGNVLAVKSLFDLCGIDYKIDADMLKGIWFKFMCNVAENMTCAMFGVPFGAFQKNDDANFFRHKAMWEVIRIANKLGIDIGQNEIDRQEHTLGRLPYENKPSTLQDLEVGKRTEVDMFAGTVVRLGKELGVETPVCECFLHGIHLIEARMFKEI